MEMKGAIFDMDGLLFDTENIYQETMERAGSREWCDSWNRSCW